MRLQTAGNALSASNEAGPHSVAGDLAAMTGIKIVREIARIRREIADLRSRVSDATEKRLVAAATTDDEAYYLLTRQAPLSVKRGKR